MSPVYVKHIATDILHRAIEKLRVTTIEILSFKAQLIKCSYIQCLHVTSTILGLLQTCKLSRKLFLSELSLALTGLTELPW